MSNKKTIFAVDDEPAILESYKNILGVSSNDRLSFFDKLDNTATAEPEYDLHVFETGEDYIQALKEHYDANKRVALSLVDMRLPGKHGLEIAKEARSLDPNMIIIIVTAYSDYSIEELLGQFEHDIYYIHKPFRKDELISIISTNIKHWSAKEESVYIKHDIAVDSIQDGLWDWKPNSNEIYLSRCWKEMLGFNDNEIQNQFDEWSNRVHPEDLQELKKDIQEHLNKETEYFINEHRLRCKDGSYKWVLSRGKALFNENNEPYRMSGFNTDITERKRLEEKLRTMSSTLSEELELSLSNESKLKNTNRELEHKLQEEIEKGREQEAVLLQNTRQAAMGEMISMIAHQWRQPITAISLVTDNILLDIDMDKLDKDEIKENLNIIHSQVNYLSHTIDDFRNFFLPNKNKEKIMIRESVESALKIIYKSLEHSGIHIEKQYADINKLSIFKNEMIQVLLNIIKNANDAFTETNITNPLLRFSTIETEDKFKIKICDNAGGIADDIIDKIYEPYFTTKQRTIGTGLGLYMSKKILEEHCNGELEAENTEDGVCFIITLPKKCNN